MYDLRRTLVCSTLALSLLAPGARATWSIAAADSRTGEVAIAGATCNAGGDLKNTIAVLLVGKGAGASQSLTSEQGRRGIGRELARGTPLEQILHIIGVSDRGLQSRQYGMADVTGDALSFTGQATGPWSGGRYGRVGSISYAIQGNVLFDENVVPDAERALIQTKGPLADRMMAAMNACARAGGDGRCTSFRKSAHVAFLVVARPGDDDGVCPFGVCINGDYFLELNVRNTAPTDPDPVMVLDHRFLNWRMDRAGRPDHFESQSSIAPPSLLADSASVATLSLHLADYFGDRILRGGASIEVTHHPQSASATVIGPVLDRGDGTYEVPLYATDRMGRDIFEVRVDDGAPTEPNPRRITLFPNPTLEVKTPARLLGDRTAVSDQRGQTVELTLRAPMTYAGRPYLVLASASGSDPGLVLGDKTLPLNPDPVLVHSWVFRNQEPFVDTQGLLDNEGDALAMFRPPSGSLAPWIGGTFTFAWMTLGPVDLVSDVFNVAIDP